MLGLPRPLARSLPLLAAALLGGAGCTAGIGTRVAEPVQPPEPLVLDEIALLPVIAEAGSEGFVPLAADALLGEMEYALPELHLLDPDEARERVGEAGAAARYAELLRNYEQSAVADRADIDAVREALGVSHFLSARLRFTEVETVGADVFSERVEEEMRREVILTVRLWGPGRSGPLWEASAQARTETGTFTPSLPESREIVRRLAEEVVARMPVEPPGASSS